MNFREFMNGFTLEDGDVSDYEFLLEKTIVADARWNGKPVQLVTQEGGGEGGSQDCFSVFLIGEGDDVQYIRVDYEYYSYEGFCFDYATVSNVKPVERLVTFYE